MDWKMCIAKMSVSSNAIYRFNVSLTKFSMSSFTKIEKNNVKMCMELQMAPNSKEILIKSKAGSITPLISNSTTNLQ